MAAGAILVAAALLLAGAATALAVLDDGPWSGYGTGTADLEYKTVTDGAAGPAMFVYDYYDDSNPYGAYGQWVFETHAVADGTREIDWTYTGDHGVEGDLLIEFFVVDEIEQVTFDYLEGTSDEFEVSGTIPSFSVYEGQPYGFRITANNYDDHGLIGELVLEGYDVVASAGDATVPTSGSTSITAVMTGSGDDQSLDRIYAYMSYGLDYVPGSATLDLTGGDVFATPLADPAIDLGLNKLTWDMPFTIDAADGLAIKFDVLVDPAFLAINDGIGDASVEVFAEVDGMAPSGVAEFIVFEGAEPAVMVLQQAVPLGGGTQTGIVGQIAGPEALDGTITFFHDTACVDGDLTESATTLGTVAINETTAIGELFFTVAVDNASPQTSGYVAAQFEGDPESPCVALGPDNDSWTRAERISITSGTGGSVGIVDGPGVARWYKFSVQPGAFATVTLDNLPADYDLAVFRDISQAYAELTDPVEDLHRLSAEFAPSVFSPSVFSPSVFSPSVFSPDAYAPSVFSPSVFSPSVFSPSVFSPSVFSPSVFSPSVFSPSVFSPSVFSPVELSPSVFSPSVFSPEAFASAQSRSIIGTSAKEGTGAEVVVANTWNNTGDFYIRVTGRNGAFAVEDAFSIDVSLEGSSCDVPSYILPAARADVAGTTVDTVILWDSSRTAGDAADIATLSQRLDELAARPEVDGVVIDLAGDAEVGALHAQADANPGCIYATNLVAESIKGIVDSYRNPELRFVTLVGGDDSIPFFRYPDQALLGPEQDYDPPVADGSASQASLRLNYILGQDEYGARLSVSLGDGTVPIPDLAVGRVVESAAEATGIIDAYLGTSDGVVSSSSSLTTGYDFLTDAATEVADHLDAGTADSGDRLIDPADRSPDDPLTWTADDLRTSLLDSGRHDLVFLAGHFSANSALAADYDTSMITTELAASPVDLLNSIVFSAGCHSGYNIVDGEIVPGVTLPLDWAQAFAQKGATLIAGTGYQYGDTDFVEYSERLYAGLAAELRTGTGAVSVGEALVEAKQDYMESTPDLRGLHRKSLIISTVFGLPMTSVDMPGERLPGDSTTSIVTGTSTFFYGPGAELGLEYSDVSVGNGNVNVTLTPVEVTLKQLPDPLPDPVTPEDFIDLIATYYEGPDGVVTNPAEPAIPLVSSDVSVDGMVLRGVGFRGASYEDVAGIVPLTGAPTTELRGVHTPFASEVFFPMRLATVNYFGELTGGGSTMLNVTPAQHRVEEIGDIESVLRLFSGMDLRLFYSSNTESYGDAVPALAAPPSISDVSAELIDLDFDGDVDDVVFTARVVGDPSAGIQEVWVTYTDATAASPLWSSTDMYQDSEDSTLWTGFLFDGASLGSLEFVVQAVNGVGLVSLDDNYGTYFEAEPEAAPVEPDPTTLALAADSSGVFGTGVTALATLTSDGAPIADANVLFSLGGTTRTAATDASGVATVTLPLTSVPGSYLLSVSYAGDDGLQASDSGQSFVIAKAATALDLVPGLDPVPPGADTEVQANLTDENGSPLKERTVYFTVTDGVEFVTIPAITNFVGEASLGVVDLPGGSYTVTARFLGNIPLADGSALSLDDPTYEASSVAGTLNLFVDDLVDSDGDGVPDDVDTDDDNDGILDTQEETLGTDPVVADAARDIRSAVHSYLGTLDGTSWEDRRIRIARLAINAGQTSWMWDDANTLDDRWGQLVFAADAASVYELDRLTNGGDLDDEAQLAIDVLLAVDRSLARNRIDAAVAAGGDQADIDAADAHMTRGDARAASEQWVRAVNQYRAAWVDAGRAVN